MKAQKQEHRFESVDRDIIRLLGHRFGDGLVYLRDTSEKQLLMQAVNMGFVNPEGYLTPSGQSLVAYHDDA